MHAACYTNCLRGSFIYYCVVAAYEKYSNVTKAVGLDPHLNERDVRNMNHNQSFNKNNIDFSSAILDTKPSNDN